MNHIEKEKLNALYQGSLSHQEQLEILSHMKLCQHCNLQFSNIVESNGLLKAPNNLKTAIIMESQSAAVQMAMQKKKTTKQLQLLIYSLKVSTAVVCTILLLGLMNMNVLNTTFSSRISGTDTRKESITSTWNQKSNEFAATLNNLSNKLINWEVTK